MIGTEVTNCGHAELAKFNCDVEMLRHDDPCIHILDSNSTAFTARSMRDDPTPIMRRRVRGTGVSAGKGDLERLRETMGLWKNADQSNQRSIWNKKQFENLQIVCEQLNGWKIKQWPLSYCDSTLVHPIYLVDSHQMNDKGDMTGRYNTMIPCAVLIKANDLPDQICSCLLDVQKGNHILPYLENCRNIQYPPQSLCFTFSHLGRTMNGDSPLRIEKLVQETMLREASRVQEQGRIHRMLGKINLTPMDIGRKGPYLRLCSYRVHAFTRDMYKDGKTKDLHSVHGDVKKVASTEEQKHL